MTTTQHTNTAAPDSDRDRDGGLGPAGVPGAHTSVIRSVSIRVAGALSTEAFAHHFGTAEQQVGVRAGDTLSYVTGPQVAEAIARAFSDGVALAERHELRYSVSATWLGVEPGCYPPTLLQRHSVVPATAVGFQPRRAISGTVVPAHMWVRIGPVLWQVCDRVAADGLAHAWSSCARLLATPAESKAAAPRPERRRLAPMDAEPAAPAPSSDEPRSDGPGRVRPVSRAEAAADPRTDCELLAAYVEGDADAFAALVVRRGAWVAEAARRVLGARYGVEDVVQDVWAQVARTAHRFEGRAAVSTWLWRMAHNAAVSTLRAERPTVADPDDQPEPGDVFGERDDVLTVRELLAVLPAAQRAAVELVDLQGFDIATAAVTLGVAEGTVKSRCQRGREAMAVEAARRDVPHPR